MSTSKNKTAARNFASAFAEAVSGSLSRAIGSPWPLELTPGSEPPLRKAEPVQFRLRIEGGLTGECFAEFYEPPVSDLASRIRGEAGGSSADSARALAGVLSESTAAMAAALAPEYGELGFGVDCVSGLAFGGMFVVPLSAPEDPSGAPVLLYFDAQLMSALAGTPTESAPVRGRAERAFNPGNLKLVMDVELNVSLRFGQRQLPLREVLELTSGSVVELDRMVDEPVELLLDGKVVARGEAVIIDGNYGLRVTEVSQSIENHFLQ